MRQVKQGSTNVTTYVILVDEVDGSPKTGIVYGAVTCQYTIGGAASTTQQSAVTQTTSGSHSDYGFVEMSATYSPGLYRVDWPDAAFASGDQVSLAVTGSSFHPALETISLHPADWSDADTSHTDIAGLIELNTQNWYVRTDGNDSNTGHFNTASGALLTIQEAVDQSEVGDTIWVNAGTYVENVSITTANGIIRGRGVPVIAPSSGVGLTISAGCWQFYDINVVPTGSGVKAVMASGGHHYFDNCQFSSLSSGSIGIELNQDNNILVRCYIYSNVAVNITGGQGHILRDCHIKSTGYTGVVGYAVKQDGEFRAMIDGCTISTIRPGSGSGSVATIGLRAVLAIIRGCTIDVSTDSDDTGNVLGVETNSDSDANVNISDSILTTAGGTAASSVYDISASNAESCLVANTFYNLTKVTGNVSTPQDRVWQRGGRTMSMSAVQISAGLVSSILTILRGDTLTVAITGLGDLTGWDELIFTVKQSVEDEDSASVLQVSKKLAGSDGLEIVDSDATVTAGNGSIVINDETEGDITITVKAVEIAKLPVFIGGVYDVQKEDFIDDGVITLTSSTANVIGDVTRST